MSTTSAFDFNWLSPLGISVALFLFYGAFYIFIGALTPILADTKMGRQVTITSSEKDNALLGVLMMSTTKGEFRR